MTEKRPRAKPLKYFFYHDELCIRLRANATTDIITVYNFAQKRVMHYIYSDVRRNGGKAFSTQEVCKLLGRKRTVVQMAIVNGNIHPPQRSWSLDGTAEKKGPYKWSEKNIMELWDFFAGIHYGHPRKDGLITPKRTLPPRRQLRAMIRDEPVFYVESEGQMIPTWKSPFD